MTQAFRSSRLPPLSRPSLLPLLAALCAATAFSLPAQAQTSTLGGGAAGSKPAKDAKILSREELRACLKRQDEMKTAQADLVAQRKALDDEKVQLVAANDQIKAERAAIEAKRPAIDDLNARMKAQGEKVQSWNERVKQANESTRTTDAQRQALEREKDELQAAGAALETERAQLAASIKDANDASNARAEPQDQKVTDWNARNSALMTKAKEVKDTQDDWAADCGNRRYREDDEKAIKAGK